MLNIGNGWEEHETMLMLTTIVSILTFKKIKKLERYRKRLKNTYKPR